MGFISFWSNLFIREPTVHDDGERILCHQCKIDQQREQQLSLDNKLQHTKAILRSSASNRGRTSGTGASTAPRNNSSRDNRSATISAPVTHIGLYESEPAVLVDLSPVVVVDEPVFVEPVIVVDDVGYAPVDSSLADGSYGGGGDFGGGGADGEF